jgi:hypothetical protein
VFVIVFSFKKNFFLRETRDGFEAFSGADQSRARAGTRVHRRPLTGSTAGITPVFKGAGERGKNAEGDEFGQNTEMERRIQAM